MCSAPALSLLPLKSSWANYILLKKHPRHFVSDAFLHISQTCLHSLMLGVMNMKCAWEDFLTVVPPWMRKDVDKLGRSTLQELRLRLGQPPEMVNSKGSVWLSRPVTVQDLNFCINIASEYSPWSASSLKEGFITACGGHRIGVCGDAIVSKDGVQGFRSISALCIRVARDISIDVSNISAKESLLIIGAPGVGKTTLLRNIIRNISNEGIHITVIDEREEIFPGTSNGYSFSPGICTDVISACPKEHGIVSAIRCMSPQIIAVDEITSNEDCSAMLYAGWCGVSLIATAHAANIDDLKNRPVYRPIIASGLFTEVIILKQDKSWVLERMTL